MNADGSGQTRLTERGDSLQPDWKALPHGFGQGAVYVSRFGKDLDQIQGGTEFVTATQLLQSLPLEGTATEGDD